METTLKYIGLIVLALVASTGCTSQAQDQSKKDAPKSSEPLPPRADPEKKSAPPKPLSADAEAPTGESKKKDERANTPPGKDRAGGGPLDGAIVDPAGVTRK